VKLKNKKYHIYVLIFFLLMLTVGYLFVTSTYETELIFKEFSSNQYRLKVFLIKVIEILFVGFWVGAVSKLFEIEEKEKTEKIETEFKEILIKNLEKKSELDDTQFEVISLKQEILEKKFEAVMLTLKNNTLQQNKK